VKLPPRTAQQNPYRKPSLSNEALVKLLTEADGLDQTEALFVTQCAEALSAGRLDKVARDRLMRIARAHSLIEAVSPVKRPVVRPYAAQLADGCRAYDALLSSAKEALTRRPPMRQVER